MLQIILLCFLTVAADLSTARPALRLPFRPTTAVKDAECSLAGLKGTSIESGACRYTVRYAHAAERWAYSEISTDFSNSSTTSLPPACPQSGNVYVQGSTSEDCLYATIYTPSDLRGGSELPVFVWVHGGSFVSGSASAPGLDGSTLAKKGIIVIVFQYRLGVLGFLPPSFAASSNDPNLGLLDLINGLKAIQTYIGGFGGDPDRVTIGGQSSGAGMIRSLLGAPSAIGLFRAAILQSDPMSYGLASPITTGQLREAYYASSPMSSCRSLACLQEIPISHILDAQDDLLSFAPYSIEGVPLAEVIRPTHDTNTVPHDPTPLLFENPHALFIPPSSIPLLITTTRNEGGSAVQGMFPVPIPASNATLASILAGLVGQDRAQAIIASGQYVLDNQADAMRRTLDRIVTDGVWKCPDRDVAKAWADVGGRVWLGEWVQGITYPTNVGDFCQAEGRVCHEDDLFPTFGSGTGVGANAKDLQDDVTDYWVSFITTLNPGTFAPKIRNDRSRHKGHLHLRQYQRWRTYSSSAIMEAIGEGEVSACPDIWGNQVKYDWQLYP